MFLVAFAVASHRIGSLDRMHEEIRVPAFIGLNLSSVQAISAAEGYETPPVIAQQSLENQHFVRKSCPGHPGCAMSIRETLCSLLVRFQWRHVEVSLHKVVPCQSNFSARHSWSFTNNPCWMSLGCDALLREFLLGESFTR